MIADKHAHAIRQRRAGDRHDRRKYRRDRDNGEEATVKLSLQPGQKTQTRERITNGLKPLVPRVLLIWAALLTFTAITTMQSVAQSVQPKPGWYYNAAGTISGESTAVYGDGTASLRIIWGNSYIYQHPGTDNLYWYAEAVYVNLGNSEVAVTCVGRSNPSLAKEWIRGDEGIPDNGAGYVAADETFCSRNPALALPSNRETFT